MCVLKMQIRIGERVLVSVAVIIILEGCIVMIHAGVRERMMLIRFYEWICAATARMHIRLTIVEHRLELRILEVGVLNVLELGVLNGLHKISLRRAIISRKMSMGVWFLFDEHCFLQHLKTGERRFGLSFRERVHACSCRSLVIRKGKAIVKTPCRGGVHVCVHVRLVEGGNEHDATMTTHVGKVRNTLSQAGKDILFLLNA
mmetsp:Transcript_93204/g.136154  ORF Transcript_93204/g.136154 Transcript_93204/m.136154 type:complete len:202 (-) Transcript_93204:997-1602(-)